MKPILKGNYAFRQVQSDYWDLIQGWLKAPEVARWRKGPGTVKALQRKLDDERIRMLLLVAT